MKNVDTIKDDNIHSKVDSRVQDDRSESFDFIIKWLSMESSDNNVKKYIPRTKNRQLGTSGIDRNFVSITPLSILDC